MKSFNPNQLYVEFRDGVTETEPVSRELPLALQAIRYGDEKVGKDEGLFVKLRLSICRTSR